MNNSGSQLKKLPELLAPAGSPQALDAALQGGADAVYLGGPSFNARASAPNFGWEELAAGVRRAHAFGAKIYLTLNTQIYDREMGDYLDAAARAYECGVDGLIVADIGGAAAIHDNIPDLPLHASTQCSGHSLAMARQLAAAGYTRMVAAREIRQDDLTNLCAQSPIEIEAFVHGALCVSHSGQCLFSSLVGGRSGNRGECAQPCRLPYGCGTGCKSCARDDYPLSLKDLSLAQHVPELIDAGVASLKIEGRMKSPAYVYGVTSIWRTLLDERRAADGRDMERLSAIFSRGGFTDGYYAGRIDKKMLGIRSEADKAESRGETFDGLSRTVPLAISAKMVTDEPTELTLARAMPGGETLSVTVQGDVPQPARTAPMTRDDVAKSLCKLGGTAYHAGTVDVTADAGLMLPVSRLNALRREALEKLDEALTPARKAPAMQLPAVLTGNARIAAAGGIRRTARVRRPEQITAKAWQFFDAIEVSCGTFDAYDALCRDDSFTPGIVLPPVIFDRELDAAKALLEQAFAAGVRYARVGNLGHIDLAQSLGFALRGDFRLNVCNSASALQWQERGIASMLLSPELTLPRMRDVAARLGPEAVDVIVYGRVPLMTVEKCMLRDRIGCEACGQNRGTLCDRRGVVFPVMREWQHRNVVYNSVPIWMADRQDVLLNNGLLGQYFLFATESPREVDAVIDAYIDGKAPTQGAAVRRM